MWLPLAAHSYYSLSGEHTLLHAMPSPEAIAGRAKALGLPACALTDHASLAGVPAFLKACGKQGVKGIPGCSLYLSDKDSTDRSPVNAELYRVTVLAKNQSGWKGILKATALSQRPEHSLGMPRLDPDRLAAFAGNSTFVLVGRPGGPTDCVWKNRRDAYACRTYEDARACVAEDWKTRLDAVLGRYLSLFGRDNFFLEIFLLDGNNCPTTLVMAKILRDAGKRLNVPCVAAADPHYLTQEDAPDQRVLLCLALKADMTEVRKKVEVADDPTLARFLRSNNYHLPGEKELAPLHTREELDLAGKIAEWCEPVNVFGPPLLPAFITPNGTSPGDYLKERCREGWRKLIQGKLSKERQKVYGDRAKEELAVLLEFNLSSYFLIVDDIYQFVRNVLKVRPGRGRGSASGCLVSYLLGITTVDPIKWDLLFERFLNKGRLAEGRNALPDIDCDFPVESRDRIIDYLRDKYGADKVAQMSTYGGFKAKAAVRDVLRIYRRCSFEEMNQITSCLVEESKISDQLQDQLEQTGSASAIRWALINRSEQLRPWAYLDEKGQLDGPFANDFAQALRLEGGKRVQGKHASGVVVSPLPLEEFLPLVWDRTTKQQLIGVDMHETEAVGGVKLDVLGLSALDKLSAAENYIRTGSLRGEEVVV